MGTCALDLTLVLHPTHDPLYQLYFVQDKDIFHQSWPSVDEDFNLPLHVHIDTAQQVEVNH